MRLKQYLSRLLNETRDTDERVFALVTLVATVASTLCMEEEAIVRSDWLFAVTGLCCMAFFVLVMTLCLRAHKAAAGGIIIASGMLFLMFPFNYFLLGGMSGGAPLWFTNYLLFISLVMSGKTRRLFALFGALVMAACIVVSVARPELLRACEEAELFRVAVGSLIAVGVMLYVMVGFGMRVLKEKITRSEEQAKEIAELNAAQNRFFSSMSHEIRTPINTIIGLNEMILRENSSPEIQEDAENIQAASKMLLQTINDILDMSKFESGEMELANTSYRTGDMLSDIVGMLWVRTRDKGLEFRVDVAPDVPAELFGDEVRIKQILINVLNNAIKYTEKGSVTLQIQCRRSPAGPAVMTYIVSDTGIGIKKESIPYLFSAFKRVDEEKNRYIEGTGLGLSIVKQLVDLMGGTISVNSVYTKGTSFVIELPQEIANDTPVGEMRASRRGMSEEKRIYHQSFEAPDAQVLAVDDTAANLMVVTKLLRDTKIRLTTASSGAEALKKTLDRRGARMLYLSSSPLKDSRNAA